MGGGTLRRSLLVVVVGLGLGTSAPPRGGGSDGGPPRKIRRLVLPPERVGEGLLWTEITDGGEAVPMLWTPADDAERAEMERFIEAAGRVDWDEPGPHDVG